MANRGALDQDEAQSRRVDHVDVWTTDRDQRTCFNSTGYNGSDETSQECIATVRSRSKGRKSSRFINASQTLHPDRPSRSDGHDMFKMVHDGPFHRNRRSFRSDGYTQNVYKMTCSSDFLSIRVGNQEIDLSRHLPSRFSWYHRVLFSFPHLRSL